MQGIQAFSWWKLEEVLGRENSIGRDGGIKDQDVFRGFQTDVGLTG